MIYDRVSTNSAVAKPAVARNLRRLIAEPLLSSAALSTSTSVRR